LDIRQSTLEDLEVTGPTHSSGEIFQGKRVLVTGHTGFKGSWLVLWLHRLGAKVTGISLPPKTRPNLYSLAGIQDHCDSRFHDIRDGVALGALIKQVEPEIVFHLAAQPLVRTSYRDPVETFATNVMGTVHVLDALRGLDQTRVAVLVTTDKVYRDEERQRPYREDDALGGHDPYSASKAASEMVIASYRDAFLAEQAVAVASARAGNVMGGGDWSEDRLIPDAVRAWHHGHTLEVRRPNAIRPWQHVLEPLAGYLMLAERLWRQPALAGAYNFGPETHETATVRDVVELARECYGCGEVRYGNGSDGPHEAEWLALEIAKSSRSLGVNPRWTLAESIEKTMSWYRACNQGEEARDLCEAQIAEYESLV
jgi:CDP-glucose 4,6-dehydratase